MQPAPADTILHVANLRTAHLQEIFGRYGELKGVELAMASRVGLPKGWARVEFWKQADAEDAVTYMDGAQLDGNVLRVDFVLMKRGGAEGRSRSRSRSGERLLSFREVGGRQPVPRGGAASWGADGGGGRGVTSQQRYYSGSSSSSGRGLDGRGPALSFSSS